MNLNRRQLGALLIATWLARGTSRAQEPTPAKPEIDWGALLPASVLQHSEDLDQMLRRRTLRVLVVPNRTNYFVDRGVQRGLTYEVFTLFGKWLERQYRNELSARGDTSKRSTTPHLHVVFAPVRYDKLLDALNSGRGDVAAANLTVTDTRQASVDFTEPVLRDVDEIIVTSPDTPPLHSLDDLAGKTVHVRRSTSYFESLTALNQRFVKDGLTPMQLELLPDELVNDDKLEMLNASLIHIAVIETPLFDFWKQVFPALVGYPNLVVRHGGNIAWAVRKTNPKLREALNRFLATEYQKGSANRNIQLARYFKNTRWAKPIGSRTAMGRYQKTVDLFRRFAPKYGFNPLLLLAQGFQESRLDQSLISPVGAIGLMQVMPETGREMKVGDIHLAGPNVQAGSAYLRKVLDRFFNEPQLTELNRMMFGFASYNAGPARISRLRDEAARRGYDRDVWFGNVEWVVDDQVGSEPVQYVGNILKYYVAYSLIAEQRERHDAALKQMQPTIAPVPTKSR